MSHQRVPLVAELGARNRRFVGLAGRLSRTKQIILDVVTSFDGGGLRTCAPSLHVVTSIAGFIDSCWRVTNYMTFAVVHHSEVYYLANSLITVPVYSEAVQVWPRIVVSSSRRYGILFCISIHARVQSHSPQVNTSLPIFTDTRSTSSLPRRLSLPPYSRSSLSTRLPGMQLTDGNTLEAEEVHSLVGVKFSPKDRGVLPSSLSAEARRATSPESPCEASMAW